MDPTHISNLTDPLPRHYLLGNLTFQATQLLAVLHTIPLSPCPCALAELVLSLGNVILAAATPAILQGILKYSVKIFMWKYIDIY